MLDGRPLIDVHLHPAHRGGLKVAWDTWLRDFDAAAIEALYDESGAVRPAAFDAMLAEQGVDVAVVPAEYSPKVTGWQPAEELLPLLSDRVRFAANVNPHLHYPVADEVERQLGLGAVALEVHPVHGCFPANDRALYPATTYYARHNWDRLTRRMIFGTDWPGMCSAGPGPGPRGSWTHEDDWRAPESGSHDVSEGGLRRFPHLAARPC